MSKVTSTAYRCALSAVHGHLGSDSTLLQIRQLVREFFSVILCVGSFQIVFLPFFCFEVASFVALCLPLYGKQRESLSDHVVGSDCGYIASDPT